MTNSSHANCSHDKTKAARAKCRRERAASRPEVEAPAAASTPPLDPFSFFPKVEDDWADAETLQWNTDPIDFGDDDIF